MATDMSERERMEEYRPSERVRMLAFMSAMGNSSDHMRTARHLRDTSIPYTAPELIPERLAEIRWWVHRAREANRQAVRLWWRR